MRGKPQPRFGDGAIAELAEAQHGVVARRQLIAGGMAEDAIDRRLRSGRLHQLHRGVYAVGHRVISREGRWMAAVLACGPSTALSHRSAAALWGILWATDGPIEVVAPAKGRSRPGVRRHSAELPADELTIALAIPVTTVPRTIFDLATVLGADRVEHALRESERLRLYDRLSLEDLLARHPRRRGAATIRECLRRRREAPPGVSREELEARFQTFIAHSRLPRPELNAWLDFGTRRYRADCLWRRLRLIDELDGFATHGTRPAFEDDRERDRILQAAGWRVVRITWRQLHDTPEAIAGDLRKVFRQQDYART
jgi:hypothetical protein